MGWRGHHNRDDDASAKWRAQPLRDRYDWVAIAGRS